MSDLLNEDEAILQYRIISKMSFPQILDLIRSGYKNPIPPSRLKEGDTVLYHQSFNVAQFGRLLNAVEEGLDDGSVRQLSLFIASSFIRKGRPRQGTFTVLTEDTEMQYWMYHIKFVGDKLFKELYADGMDLKEYNQKAMLERIDRPTIVFNVITGEKWICDWTHPRYSGGIVKMPGIKFHSGSSGVFNVSKITILNPYLLSDNLLNWLSVNPFEVKE